MSQDSATQINAVSAGAGRAAGRGLIDLYMQRMEMVRSHQVTECDRALERMVVTQPFGRAFTAQPSFPPDPPETQGSRIAGLRRKLAGTAAPVRKLATS